uniref:Eukaryotic translation initiation factor 4 gamma 3 n=1 Tax=Zonotrichia albicollis TaxID=44394 RepID=A0A8D2NEC9_ZONAL
MCGMAQGEAVRSRDRCLSVQGSDRCTSQGWVTQLSQAGLSLYPSLQLLCASTAPPMALAALFDPVTVPKSVSALQECHICPFQAFPRAGIWVRWSKPEVPPAPVQEKPSLSEEEIERKCKSIIDEFLHINDFKEAMQCVEELSAQSLLPVFVRVGVESTLERSQITRDHMGQLLHQLVHSGKLSKQEFFKGFSETLEMADDMAIDIPHIWLYLAELVTPMLKEGGISMRELIQEFSKPLLPVGRAGVLLAEILHLLCKQMSHKKVGALWRESGLSWKDYLPEGEDVHTFLMEQVTLSEKELSAEELNKQLEKLIVEDKANDEQIFDWVEANLDESQMSSPTFLRALMTAVCKAAIIEVALIPLCAARADRCWCLYPIPADLLRMFFDCLYDEEVISEDAFYKWESSKDPAEQNGKGVALKSVTAFFTWLREAEEESEDN